MGSKQIKHQTVTTPKLWWLLVGASIITTIAIRRNFELTSPSITPPNITQTDSWKKITDGTAQFYSKIFLNRDKTFIYIPLKFDGERQVTWLILDSTASAVPATLLIAHPTMEKVDWPFINDKTVYLYQKKATYKTIEDFVKNPPDSNRILIEKPLRKVELYNKIKAQDLPRDFDLNSVDFILTTYKHTNVSNGILLYENIIDATSGTLNQDDSLSWYINVPSATNENPFYIGEIHVDYR